MTSRPTPSADLAIGVAHAPYLRVLDRWNSLGYPLIMAGHTHGGQLCLPFYGALVTNCDLDRTRAKGLHKHQVDGHDPSWLHVSAGLGTSPFTPVRFACRPEATLLTLTEIDSPGSSQLGNGRGVAQLGSARRSGRRGRRFKSCHPDVVEGAAHSR